MPETYRTTTSSKEALQNCLAFNSRDWGAVKADAWIWGIVFGWDADDDEGDPMAEVAARHGWDAFDVENLRTLHADFDRLEAPPAADAPLRRGDRVRWDAVLSFALVVSVRPRAGTTTVYVSPDYAPTTVVAVDLKELARA